MGINPSIPTPTINRMWPISFGTTSVTRVITMPPTNHNLPANRCVAFQLSSSSNVHGVRMPTK